MKLLIEEWVGQCSYSLGPVNLCILSSSKRAMRAVLFRLDFGHVYNLNLSKLLTVLACLLEISFVSPLICCFLCAVVCFCLTAWTTDLSSSVTVTFHLPPCLCQLRLCYGSILQWERATFLLWRCIQFHPEDACDKQNQRNSMCFVALINQTWPPAKCLRFSPAC